MMHLAHLDLESWICRFICRHKESIQTFGIAFLVNVFVYMQKLTWHSLAIDDYTRFLGAEDQAANQGRWGANVLNYLFFSGHQHIVPYFNGLIGIFSFTLAGFITAKIFGVNGRFRTICFTLLCSLSVFIAHNLYYNTNITVWISVLLCVLATYLLLQPGAISKSGGFLTLVFALGNYQTNLQLYLMLMFSLWLFTLLRETQPTSGFIATKSVRFLVFFLVGLAAMGINILINHLWVNAIGTEQFGTFAKAANRDLLGDLFTNIGKAYTINLKIRYFQNAFAIFYFIPIIMLVVLLRKAWQIKDRSATLLLILAVVAYYVVFPLIIALPQLAGFGVLPRVHYTIGWFFAIMYLFSLVFSHSKTTQSGILLLSFGLLLLSTVYINIYFYAAYRQTQSDIHRVNNIVTQIRMHENYTDEEQPLKLMLIGEKEFPVVGWTTRREALRWSWSKYQAFDYFTDLKFIKMKKTEYEELRKEFGFSKENSYNYPAKDSIIMKERNVVVILKAEKA